MQAQRTRGGYGGKYFEESPSLLDVDGFRFSDSSAVEDSPIYGEGTIWDLVPLSIRSAMYPHQCGGFEFMWKNIAGDIALERLREPLSDSKGGCIISHPPGTGKSDSPLLLLNWEAEFQKWEADIPFHNLNSKDLSFRKDEEGHIARNEQSLVWKALKEVETEKRIVLSGTPFQNNIKELYNTLCLAKRKEVCEFESQLQEIRWLDPDIGVKMKFVVGLKEIGRSSSFKVLLASTEACSEGITLIGASRVVLLDALRNPSVEQQAISRSYTNEDDILEAMVKHEGLRHIFEKLSPEPRWCLLHALIIATILLNQAVRLLAKMQGFVEDSEVLAAVQEFCD
ncbi:hypothetical protein FXO38_15894 [Capsicum annuum]|uniref:Uncharacterized protein n=1 Tax=Capsicum annuum TaxID=4072 RepID=A0A2G3AHI2_CAPAN|nr:hypothetical protein FXO38_15894 [Capsicum annuum]KAF3668951.1 hypothetical protein FXO37_09274 [Capsicum annuum]PHT93692.1 hypothetical protein T459_01574 [Capsicum annuum]